MSTEIPAAVFQSLHGSHVLTLCTEHAPTSTQTSSSASSSPTCPLEDHCMWWQLDFRLWTNSLRWSVQLKTSHKEDGRSAELKPSLWSRCTANYLNSWICIFSHRKRSHAGDRWFRKVPLKNKKTAIVSLRETQKHLEWAIDSWLKRLSERRQQGEKTALVCVPSSPLLARQK